MNNTRAGYLLVLISAATFAFSSVIAKWAYESGIDPYTYALGTSALTAALLVFSLRQGRWRWPAGVHPLGLLVYLLSGAAAGLMFLLSLLYLDIGLTTLLVFTSPAVVVLGAWVFLGQRPSLVKLAAVGLTLVGAVFTTGPVPGGAQLLGVLFALGANLSHSTNILMGERILPGWDAKVAVFYGRLLSILLVLAVAPAAGRHLTAVSGSGWGMLLLGAVVGALVPFVTLMEGIVRVGASRAAIVSSAELPIALVLGGLLLGERLTPVQWVGAVLIILAVVLIQRQE